ncbi:hypothetical protein Neosp_014553 [[Neocosmospora] mangrovei]
MLYRSYLERLTDTGIAFYGNAALTRTELVKKIQETLQTLHDIGRSIPTLFGYFDLDATFSAAFVLTMMGFVEGDLQEPPEGLKQAAEILKYLSNAGNTAAQRRLNDLKQFCLHVWSPTNMTDDWSWLKEGSVSSLDNSPANRHNFSGDAGGNPNLQADAMTTWGPAAWISWQSTAAGGEDAVHLDFSASENFQMDLSHEAGDIYSSFNDPTLPLTGVDDVDWAEVGKMFHMRNI